MFTIADFAENNVLFYILTTVGFSLEQLFRAPTAYRFSVRVLPPKGLPVELRKIPKGQIVLNSIHTFFLYTTAAIFMSRYVSVRSSKIRIFCTLEKWQLLGCHLQQKSASTWYDD